MEHLNVECCFLVPLDLTLIIGKDNIFMITQVWVSCSSVRLVGESYLAADEDSDEDEEEDKSGEEDVPIYTDEEYDELGQAFDY